MSQIARLERSIVVDAPSEAVAGISGDQAQPNIEAVFHLHYERMARVIARVIRDPARAEELAVEVFLKWSLRPAPLDGMEGWLYRTAVRLGLDELRRQTRRSRFEGLLQRARPNPTPEEIHASREEQDRVRLVLAAIGARHGELLLLRDQGLSYTDIASALGLNPASIGTLLSRAQQAFRKEYIKRYGNR